MAVLLETWVAVCLLAGTKVRHLEEKAEPYLGLPEVLLMDRYAYLETLRACSELQEVIYSVTRTAEAQVETWEDMARAKWALAAARRRLLLLHLFAPVSDLCRQHQRLL